MKLRSATTSLVLLTLITVLLTPTAESYADPILKPKKYHGPIPKRSWGLSIGFLTGADNEEMFGYLGRIIDQPLRPRAVTQDFGSSPVIDLYYTAKMHPNFAFRGVGGATFLRSSSEGLATAADPDTSGQLPLVKFERNFDVILFSLEATGMYYFQDASVSEFQAYIGGGLSFFIPWARYEELTFFEASGQPYTNSEESKLSTEPGVHAVLGALYHIRNTVAFFTEAKYQIGQSTFELDLPTIDAGIQNLSFVVSYSGLVLVAGVSKFF